MRAVVESWRMGITAEEIPQGLPHLTLAQVFDALSYYLDTKVKSIVTLSATGFQRN